MYIDNESFLSRREYDSCPVKDERGRLVFDEKTGKQFYTSKKFEVDQSQIPGCIDLDNLPDLPEEIPIIDISSTNILYRRLVEREHDENPYDQARRIIREKQGQRSGYGKQLRRGYID